MNKNGFVHNIAILLCAMELMTAQVYETKET
jgi:hypothetical protein